MKKQQKTNKQEPNNILKELYLKTELGNQLLAKLTQELLANADKADLVKVKDNKPKKKKLAKDNEERTIKFKVDNKPQRQAEGTTALKQVNRAKEDIDYVKTDKIKQQKEQGEKTTAGPSQAVDRVGLSALIKGKLGNVAIAAALAAAAAEATLATIFPGQSTFTDNFGGYKQSVTSGTQAVKDISTWAVFFPLSAMTKGIW